MKLTDHTPSLIGAVRIKEEPPANSTSEPAPNLQQVSRTKLRGCTPVLAVTDEAAFFKPKEPTFTFTDHEGAFRPLREFLAEWASFARLSPISTESFRGGAIIEPNILGYNLNADGTATPDIVSYDVCFDFRALNVGDQE